MRIANEQPDNRRDGSGSGAGRSWEFYVTGRKHRPSRRAMKLAFRREIPKNAGNAQETSVVFVQRLPENQRQKARFRVVFIAK
jgi:hypothetical protein